MYCAYRIIYEIQYEQLVICVVRVRHRRDVYRQEVEQHQRIDGQGLRLWILRGNPMRRKQVPEEMKALEITKLECARRQLETGIDLFFQKSDPVSIHTLTSAAYNIIRDVNISRGGKPMFAKERYVQMGGKLSLHDLNEPENFFKHADRDADAQLTFFPVYTECFLAEACKTYGELTGEHVQKFDLFTLWFICQAPEIFDIPRGWESFADDAREFYANDDRIGFHDRLVAHLSELPDRGT